MTDDGFRRYFFPDLSIVQQITLRTAAQRLARVRTLMDRLAIPTTATGPAYSPLSGSASG